MGCIILGRKLKAVLARINAALIRFLEPIAASTNQNIHPERESDQQPQLFKRFKKETTSQSQAPSEPHKAPAQRPHLRLVKQEPLSQVSVDSSLEVFELLTTLRSPDEHSRRKGISSYRSALQEQRRKGKSRKGSILDQQSD